MHLANYGAPSCNYMYTCKILIGVDPVVYFSICIDGMNSSAYSMGSQRTSTTGWWYTYPSEKYDFVSWDDDIPNWMEKNMLQTTNQFTSIYLIYPPVSSIIAEDRRSTIEFDDLSQENLHR